MISGLGDLKIGGGNYNGRELAGDEVNVSISGLGSAAVLAREQLDATISGGGSVRYAGRPQETKEISGLSEREPIGDE